MQPFDFNPHIQEEMQEQPENNVLASQESAQPAPSQTVLGAGEWLRAVSDFRAPFGFDRLPTVWG